MNNDSKIILLIILAVIMGWTIIDGYRIDKLDERIESLEQRFKD